MIRLRRSLVRGLRIDRAFRLVWSIAPGWTIASFALAAMAGLLPLASLYLLKLIADSVTKGVSEGDTSFWSISVLIILAGAVSLLGAALRAASSIVGETLGMLVTDHVAGVLHAKSLAVDLEYYDNPKYYDMLHRAQKEAPYRPTRIVNGLVQLGQSTITLVAIAGLLLSLQWAVAVVLVAAVLPGAWVRARYSGRLFRWQHERTAAERKADYLNWLITGAGSAKEIRLLDLGGLLAEWFRELRAMLRGQRLALARQRSLAGGAAESTTTLAVFGSLAFVAWQTLRGAISLGGLVMFYQAVQTGLGAMRQFLGGLTGLYEDNLFLTFFYEFLDIEPKVVDPPDPRPIPEPIRSGLKLDRVSFQYPGSSRTALSNVSLEILPGEVVALAGTNGSGKTTLVKLLTRLYDPTSGLITLDGIDLREFATSDLRHSFSVISQDYLHFNLTARENVWVGDIALDPHDQRITDAARTSGADPIITSLSNGYDTMLGRWFENGEELSTGEWQKVALARAFVRDAPFVVLDEPTSALDPTSEWEVFQGIRRLANGRAVLLISHRFSTVHMADRIHVLHEGSIIESGTHDDLVRLGGTYARMYALQAQAFSGSSSLNDSSVVH